MSKECSCGVKDDLTEIYTGDDIDEDEKQLICPACLKREQAQDNIDFCRCCGSDIAYYVDDLDEKSLCPEHKGEFDLDEKETQDMEDFIEYHTKDS